MVPCNFQVSRHVEAEEAFAGGGVVEVAGDLPGAEADLAAEEDSAIAEAAGADLEDGEDPEGVDEGEGARPAGEKPSSSSLTGTRAFSSPATKRTRSLR